MALGNALTTDAVKKDAAKTAAIVTALQSRLNHPSELVREHVQWALQQAPAKCLTLNANRR